MTENIINSLVLAGLFLALFAIGELLYHQTKMKADDTRKVVHIGTGLLTMLFPVMLQSHWFVLLLCASFGLILFTSLKFNLLKSINAIDRVSYGSLLYPVAVYACFCVYTWHNNNYLYFYLPVLTMAISDPVAAVFGKTWPYGKFYVLKDKKTLVGSLAFFLSACIVSVVLFYFLPQGEYGIVPVGIATLSSAAGATLAEAFSAKGFDNLTIPVSVVFVLTLLDV